jgi:hypothetical protein
MATYTVSLNPATQHRNGSGHDAIRALMPMSAHLPGAL